MNYAKFGKGSAFAVLEHIDRGQEGVPEHEHSNENIDKSRTHLNYDLKDRGGLTAYAYYKKRIDEIAKETKERTGKGLRKDAVTLCSWIITAPKDLPEDKQADFFKGAYQWFCERYGEENVVTSAVHMDEVTPHMHFQFTPIIEKNSVRKLCAKDLETPKRLRTVHPKLQEYLTKELDCPVTLLNGATDNGNKTVEQLKTESLKAENERIKAENEELKAKCEEMEKELDKALAYTPPKRKRFETDRKYAERMATSYQAHALDIRSERLDERKQQLDERDKLADERKLELDAREQELSERDEKQAERDKQIARTYYNKGAKKQFDVDKEKIDRMLEEHQRELEQVRKDHDSELAQIRKGYESEFDELQKQLQETEDDCKDLEIKYVQATGTIPKRLSVEVEERKQAELQAEKERLRKRRGMSR